MAVIDGGDAESVYGTGTYVADDVCLPTGAIWPDPTVIIPPEDATPEQEDLLELRVQIALGLAWTTLQSLTAYQLAICPVVVRPCKQSCAYGNYLIAPVVTYGPELAPFWPNVRNGQWTNVWCGHRYSCECTEIQQVTLPGPVGEIVEVVIDGVVLDPGAYRVDSGNRLVRQDGLAWPVCQDFNAPAGEVGTWTVEYYHGATSDMLVRYAAGILANEYLTSMFGGECRLPQGVTQVVRQGITFEVQQDMFENGLTTIPEVDAVTARFNPFRNKMPAAIFNPDLKPGRVTTWRAPN
jgi:hypothetical protein